MILRIYLFLICYLNGLIIFYPSVVRSGYAMSQRYVETKYLTSEILELPVTVEAFESELTYPITIVTKKL